MNFLQDVPMKIHQCTNALALTTVVWVMSRTRHPSVAKIHGSQSLAQGPCPFPATCVMSLDVICQT